MNKKKNRESYADGHYHYQNIPDISNGLPAVAYAKAYARPTTTNGLYPEDPKVSITYQATSPTTFYHVCKGTNLNPTF